MRLHHAARILIFLVFALTCERVSSVRLDGRRLVGKIHSSAGSTEEGHNETAGFKSANPPVSVSEAQTSNMSQQPNTNPMTAEGSESKAPTSNTSQQPNTSPDAADVSVSEAQQSFTRAITAEVYRQFVRLFMHAATALARRTPEPLIGRLLGVQTIQDALVSFMEKTRFLETLVLRASTEVFTETLCGRKLRMTVGNTVAEGVQMTTDILVKSVECGDACQRRLNDLIEEWPYALPIRRDWEQGTAVNGLVDMESLVNDERIQGILLDQLATHNGWLQGIDEDRLTEVAGALELTGIPLPLGGVTRVHHKFSVRIDIMTRRAPIEPRPVPDAPDPESESSRLLRAMLNTTQENIEDLIVMTLAGAMDTIVSSRSIFFSERLPGLLNAVADPWKIKVKLIGCTKFLPGANWAVGRCYGTDASFLTEPRDMSACPPHLRG